MKLFILSIWCLAFVVNQRQGLVFAQDEEALFEENDDSSSGDEFLPVFNCTFENGACDFALVEPGHDAPDQALRWYRRQAVILSNGKVLNDHTKRKNDGTFLFAEGGYAGSLTTIETSTTIRCMAKYCCFNAFALMNQAQTVGSSGSLAFYVIPEAFAEAIVLANVSFSSFGNYWTNVQRSFHSNNQPFRIAIEGRNGASGSEFYLAVDDISVTTGACEGDMQQVDTSKAVCGSPPGVVGAEALISMKDTSMTTGAQISYSCVPGHTLLGPRNVTCSAEGHWSTAPICTRTRGLQSYRGAAPDFGLIDPMNTIFAEEQLDVNNILTTDCVWGKYIGEEIPHTMYTDAESELVLFINNPLTCSGNVLRWVFLINDNVPDGTPVYLSIWRPVVAGKQYKLIGFNQFTTKRSQEIIQFLVPGDSRISVKQGDVIGIIHKQTSDNGAVFVYDSTHLPVGGEETDLFDSIVYDFHIEDLNTTGPDTFVFLNSQTSTKKRMQPLLQVYMSGSDCALDKIPGVTFTGFNTTLPSALTKDDCYTQCNQTDDCYAVTWFPDSNECRTFSYISTEIHLDNNIESLVKSCHSDCDTLMLSNQIGFDLKYTGTTIKLGKNRVAQSPAECELICRYTPICIGFSYMNPFEIGSCVLFSNTTGLQYKTDSRTFRKWGCADIKLLQDCNTCIASFQCKSGGKCTLTGNPNLDATCLPPSGDDSVCRPTTTPPTTQQPVPNIVTEVPCTAPPTILNGYIYKSESSSATYMCNDGYEINGPSQIDCINGVWQTPPFCKPSCPQLPVVEHGRVDEVPNKDPRGGRLASVTCNDGYKLQGAKQLVCLGPKGWSPSAKCVPLCVSPPSVIHATTAIIKGATDAPLAAQYKCDSGYQLNGSNIILCVQGKWVPPSPNCSPIPPAVKCPPVPTIANGKVINLGRVDPTLANNNTNLYADFQCLSGYELIGQPRIFCPVDKWQDPPQCSPLCDPIPTVPNASVKIVTYKNGNPTLVQFTCFDGFKMIGDPIVQCISSSWTHTPQCVNDTKPAPKYCGQPPDILYGTWKPVSQIGNTTISADYTCLTNYTLLGPQRLNCLRTNTSISWNAWNGTTITNNTICYPNATNNWNNTNCNITFYPWSWQPSPVPVCRPRADPPTQVVVPIYVPVPAPAPAPRPPAPAPAPVPIQPAPYREIPINPVPINIDPVPFNPVVPISPGGLNWGVPSVPGVGLGVPGTGIGIPGTGLGIPGTGLGVPGTGLGIPGTGIGIPGTGLGIPGTGLGVPGTGLGIPGTGLGLPGTGLGGGIGSGIPGTGLGGGLGSGIPGTGLGGGLGSGIPGTGLGGGIGSGIPGTGLGGGLGSGIPGTGLGGGLGSGLPGSGLGGGLGSGLPGSGLGGGLGSGLPGSGLGGGLGSGIPGTGLGGGLGSGIPGSGLGGGFGGGLGSRTGFGGGVGGIPGVGRIGGVGSLGGIGGIGSSGIPGVDGGLPGMGGNGGGFGNSLGGGFGGIPGVGGGFSRGIGGSLGGLGGGGFGDSFGGIGVGHGSFGGLNGGFGGNRIGLGGIGGGDFGIPSYGASSLGSGVYIPLGVNVGYGGGSFGGYSPNLPYGYRSYNDAPWLFKRR